MLGVRSRMASLVMFLVCSAGFLRVATANDTYNYTFMINWVDISSEVSTSVKFVDAVVANNGKVIFAPTEEDAVGVFDPCSNTFEAVDISSYQLTGLARKFYSAALAKDGRVVFAPAHANGVGVFDPRDNSFELVNISSHITIEWKFRGAATANNGKVIFAPMNADGVGVFDPSDHSFELVDISSHITSDWKFNGATLAKNGLIIFSPLAAGTGLGVFNPMDNSFELVPISSYDGMTGSMGAFVTLSNGEMVCPPRTATAVGVFNPVTKAFRTVPITVAADNDDKFHAAALTNDGKVVFAPGGALGVGVFDPTDDSFEYVDYSAQINTAGVAKFWGAALVRNGAVVFTPTTSDRVGIFYPSGTPPAPCCLTSTLDVKNGGVGDCAATLLDGETCQPECADPYEASGATTCLDGVLNATTCIYDVSCDMEKCCYDFNVRNEMTTTVGCDILHGDFVPVLPPPRSQSPTLLDAFRSLTLPADSTTVTTTSEHKFLHAVKAPHKNVVYFVPMNIDVIGKLDVESETFSELRFTSLTGTTQNYEGGTVVGSKIYMAPMHKNHIGVFDTETEEYSTIAVYTSSTPLNMAYGPPASIGTKVYVCPNRAGDVMAVIDTSADPPTVDKITLPAIPNYSGRRFAGAYAVGDKIVCSPYGRFDGGIGIFDTTTQTWTRRDITDVVPNQASNGYYMYGPGCVAGDVVYFAGDRRAGIGKYNVTADDFREIAVELPGGKFGQCAVLGGKVYFTAASGQDILVLDVATDSYQIVQLTDAMIKMVAPKKTFGGAAVAEDRLIFPPFAVADVGILEHQS